ncbi:MAG: 30S ribosomal protein S16 [Endomicrobium sp.]|jgi:small subunit ribosomal protein S16|nr:30S ribosomal protein S16 [Endomicrobium sp.]
MAVKVRLQRIGKRKKPCYRIVVMDQRTKRDGKTIEILGNYYPLTNNSIKFNINFNRLNYWISVGAKTSKTLSNLISKTKN